MTPNQTGLGMKCPLEISAQFATLVFLRIESPLTEHRTSNNHNLKFSQLNMKIRKKWELIRKNLRECEVIILRMVLVRKMIL
ncbi:hypothetical protein AKJ40_04615 [candidate division MSBL1 archaeon SCGC-AAA259M10]|uniref:Uncharacterized protein n=1 Tax=candidate division MSBL1 archaeon SCGC-AAA259M10 TaxID=1698270 RepID=A0A133UWP1_9EURY|nr:hypothetical protein AKJ40_04615 [candidate division MSBL1 archaeon SCGC-AAA259M10]